MDAAAALAKVFDVAEKELSIPQILDPSDLLDISGTDECRYNQSIILKANLSFLVV